MYFTFTNMLIKTDIKIFEMIATTDESAGYFLIFDIDVLTYREIRKRTPGTEYSIVFILHFFFINKIGRQFLLFLLFFQKTK